jgi:hypothetical protein
MGGGCSFVNNPVDPTKCEPQAASVAYADDAACDFQIEIPCLGDASVDSVDACAVCGLFEDAGPSFGSCSSVYNDNGGMIVYCGGCCIGGRAPRGFTPRVSRSTDQGAQWLARMAQVEAASVGAFDALHDDLARHGAPRGLLAAVRSASSDEVRHARSVGRAAAWFGAHVPAASTRAPRGRSLAALALDNATEGCVGETFGAAVAAVQAERAGDRRVRRLMKGVARDEVRHAALAWRIADWLDARLDVRTRARVRRARGAALESTAAAIAREGPGDERLGLPTAERLGAILASLADALEKGTLKAG